MDEIDLDASEMPKSNIDEHLKTLRAYHPQTDQAKIAAASPKSLATAPALCTLAHAFADYIDVMRANGFSVGEAMVQAERHLMAPISDMPVIDTMS